MTIELHAKKWRLPYEWTRGAIVPMNCLTELGVLYVRNKGSAVPLEAVHGKHGKTQSLVLIPKITTSDESLRRFPPEE